MHVVTHSDDFLLTDVLDAHTDTLLYGAVAR